MGRLLAAIRLDVGPLRRHRDFRRLYAAATISLFGSFVTMIAAPLQIKELTGSYVAVGAVGIAEFVPLMIFGLWGGAVADARDRRSVVLASEAISLILSVVLVGNALLGRPQVWVIYLVAAGAAGASAVQRPSYDALLPRLVPHQDQSAASALTGLQHTSAEVIVPAFAGLLAVASLPLAYTADVVSFVLSLALMAGVRSVPIEGESAPITLSAIGEGVRYALSRRDLLGTYLVDIAAMGLAMPTALFPFLADQLHHPGSLGLFYSAGAVGGLLAAVTSGWTKRVHRHGLAVAVGATIWGLGMALAGIAPGLWLVLAGLAVAGAGDMVSGTFRGALWNQTIPDQLRGRLAGIELLSYSSGPSLGGARAGIMAHLGGVRFSIGGGGLLCIGAVAAVTAALPAFRRYDVRTDPHAAAERRRRAAVAEAGA